MENRIEFFVTNSRILNTHIFADGQHVLTVVGHTINPASLKLHKCSSVMSAAFILFRGKLLTADMLSPEGFISLNDFELVYDDDFLENYIEPTEEMKKRVRP